MPRDGSTTRARILDAAQVLVERNGFAATSVDSVIAASRSSKGAFFHHFDSKRALASALVDRYVDADLEQLQRGLAAVDAAQRAGASPAEQVLAFLDHYERWAQELVAEDSSCLYLAVLTERDLLEDSTRTAVTRAIDAWGEAFAALLRPALADARVDHVDARDLADHLFVTFEGGFLLCRSLRAAEPMQTQLRVVRQLVAALLGVR